MGANGIRPYRRYPGRMSGQRVPGGVVHELPADLREALIGNDTAFAAWRDITPAQALLLAGVQAPRGCWDANGVKHIGGLHI
jgi:hypothetical protein